jgi:hypothetical protein
MPGATKSAHFALDSSSGQRELTCPRGRIKRSTGSGGRGRVERTSRFGENGVRIPLLSRICQIFLTQFEPDTRRVRTAKRGTLFFQSDKEVENQSVFVQFAFSPFFLCFRILSERTLRFSVSRACRGHARTDKVAMPKFLPASSRDDRSLAFLARSRSRRMREQSSLPCTLSVALL